MMCLLILKLFVYLLLYIVHNQTYTNIHLARLLPLLCFPAYSPGVKKPSVELYRSRPLAFYCVC